MPSDAAFGEDEGDDLLNEHGWTWPTRPGEDWYVRYAFRDTLVSYKPHFWAGSGSSLSRMHWLRGEVRRRTVERYRSRRR
ncbi:hypothetical protein [Streptomyces xinghaiensis]|uniref:hypothetical protein n=1 Tax=Streptomyces xinghaiensis TaxID=1038928 RepID=UPI00030BB667|nr:hypothetical protein [Streptomyces xinghaiensis]MZE76710.1 hypothetical protein [Streptomyces sp. SID5475]